MICGALRPLTFFNSFSFFSLFLALPIHPSTYYFHFFWLPFLELYNPLSACGVSPKTSARQPVVDNMQALHTQHSPLFRICCLLSLARPLPNDITGHSFSSFYSFLQRSVTETKRSNAHAFSYTHLSSSSISYTHTPHHTYHVLGDSHPTYLPRKISLRSRDHGFISYYLESRCFCLFPTFFSIYLLFSVPSYFNVLVSLCGWKGNGIYGNCGILELVLQMVDG